MTSTQLETRRTSLLILAALAALMLLTRTHNFMLGGLLPDASWAVFLLGGFFLKQFRYLAALGALAWLIDVAVTVRTPAAAYCFSPAYVALVASWVLLWSAGRFSNNLFSGSLAWLKLPLLPIAGVCAAYLVSNLGFYALSGNFAGMSLAEYAGRVARYFDGFLFASLGYFLLGVAIAPAIAKLVEQARSALKH